VGLNLDTNLIFNGLDLPFRCVLVQFFMEVMDIDFLVLNSNQKRAEYSRAFPCREFMPFCLLDQTLALSGSNGIWIIWD
jgi:hypothetical protein